MAGSGIDEEDQSRIVCMPFGSEHYSDDDNDVELPLVDSLVPFEQEQSFNPSQNNNAKRQANGNLNRRRHNTPQEREQGRLFHQIIRENPEEEDAKDHDLRPQTNLGWGFPNFELEPPRPPMSVGAIRLKDLPNPTLPMYRGHNIFGPSRTAEQDILKEWRTAGLIKKGDGGVAFEVSFSNSEIKHPGPQKQRRVHKLSSMKNRDTNGEHVKRMIEQKQRRASERRKRATSAIKERLAITLQQRKQHVKERYEEDEDYKQRTAHMKIIEKQSKCAVNREKRETEFRQKMEERRRRRDNVRKRARRKLNWVTDDNVDHDKLHSRNSDGSGDYDLDNNSDKDDDDDDDDGEDGFVESSPQVPRYYYQFDY